jgi:NADH-quinone oxidoreductase subunit E
MATDFGLQTASGHLEVPAESKEPYPADVEAAFREDAAQVIARYPQKRSALLPLLHLVQSVDGYVTGRGLDLCAELLDLTTAEVSGVATFYTQYKRHPNGEYTVGVCTNTLCAIMGGDEIWDAVSEHLGIGHDETTEDGRITLERVECNAACDYAPVVMTNWEFFDNQTPESTVALVDELRAGNPVTPTRGPARVRTFKEVSRVLAGFPDGAADEGVGAGPASLVGLGIAKENGWEAPRASRMSTRPEEGEMGTAPKDSDGDAPGRTEVTPKSPEAAAGTQAAPKATDPSDAAGGPAAKDADEVTAPDSPANVGHDEIQDIGMTEPDEAKGDGEEETR